MKFTALLKRTFALCMIAFSLACTAAAKDDTMRPSHPAASPDSPVMLAGAWLPGDPHRLDFAKLPRVPSTHVVINDVRAKGSSPNKLNREVGGVNQHNYLAFHDGRFWAMWSDGPGIEDKVGQCVKYATSNDGLKWGKPQRLTPFPPNSGPNSPHYGTRTNKGMRWIARGFWKREGELLALASLDEAAGCFGPSLELRAFRFNKKRDAWEEAGLVFKNAINNFPPLKLRTGDWMMSRRPHNYTTSGVHFLVGGVKAIDDWQSFPVLGSASTLKAEEPNWWVLPDNSLSAIFRDNRRSGYIYRAISTDDGRTWSKPVKTNFPDATSKIRGLRLSDGRYVLVSNPNPRRRDPLTLAISPDGLVFTKMLYLVGGRWVDYPDVIEHKGSLYIAFAGGKQSVEVLKVKLADMDAVSMPTSPLLASEKPSKEAPMSYRQFNVVERDGQVAATEPIRPEKTPAWARNVSQDRHDWSKGPDMAKPYYKAPIPFVLPPVDKAELFHGHNHCPALTWCPNGDLLAIWFSTTEETETEMTILASRLRAGAESWEPASEFFKGKQRNMTGSALLHDGKGRLYHINGMGPRNVRHWKKLAMLLRTSSDNGRTWTAARPISTGGKYTLRHQPIAGAFITKSGAIIQACDGTWSGEGPTAIHISRDGGKTWTDPGGNIRGIHAGIVELKEGRLMAFGRGQAIEGKMPMSISSDMGKTWTHKASLFPPIGSAQRLVLMRLREGPLMLVSFSNTRHNHPFANKYKGAAGIEAHDLNGELAMVHGPFVTLSFDDGKTWPVKRLLSAPKTAGLGNEIHKHFVKRVTTNYKEFTLNEQHGEPFGYLTATQTPDGVIHLVSSALYYRFNLSWCRGSFNAGR